MMVIEFFGLFGAGKTYIAQKVSDKEKIKNLKINNRIEKYFLVLLFFILHPLFFSFLLKIIIKETKNNLKLLRHKIFFLFFDVVAREMKAYFKEVSINDQGFFQFLISIYEREINKEELNKYLQYFKRERYFLYIIKAGRNTREKRMKNRGRFPRSVFGEEYARKWHKISEHNFDVIKNFITSNFKYKIIIND